MDTIVLIDIYLTGCILSYPFMLGFMSDLSNASGVLNPRVSFQNHPVGWTDYFDGKWENCLYLRKEAYWASIVSSLFSWITLGICLIYIPLSCGEFPRPRLFLSKLPDKEEFRSHIEEFRNHIEEFRSHINIIP